MSYGTTIDNGFPQILNTSLLSLVVLVAELSSSLSSSSSLDLSLASMIHYLHPDIRKDSPNKDLKDHLAGSDIGVHDRGWSTENGPAQTCLCTFALTSTVKK